MNKLKGKIVSIETSKHMSMVDVEVKGEIFSAIVLETPETAEYLKIGGDVFIVFKETEVSIAKNLSGLISIRNRIKSKIKRIDSDGILTKVTLSFNEANVISVISTKSARKLELKNGDDVEWLVKTNEISLYPDI